MKISTGLTVAGFTTAVSLIVQACSSSSSSSSAADSGSASDTGSSTDSTTGSGDTGAGVETGDTGSAADTGTSADSGMVGDAISDSQDAPYCAAVQGLIDAGALPASGGGCFDLCCSQLTTCVQSAECFGVFQCVARCSKTTDAGAQACITQCEADASSQAATEVNALATCLNQHGCH
jgi:hypothetical protein